MHNLTEEALNIIDKIQKIEHKLSSYEANLLKHVLGVYYLAKHDYLKAIQALKSIMMQFIIIQNIPII